MADSQHGNDIETILSKNLSKEQRIKLRKDRMNNRKLKNSLKYNNDTTINKNIIKSSISTLQIDNSRDNIDNIKSQGWNDITTIRLDAYARESQRRLEEEIRSKQRVLKVDDEADNSNEINKNIELNWSELQKSNIPQDLHRDISAQQEACMEVLAAKNSLVIEFQEELNSKNDVYVKMLLQQGEDISELLSKMHKQYALLQKTYEEEEARIESAFLEERKNIVSSNKKEIDALFEKRHTMELQILDRKIAREDSFATQLEETRTLQTEDYNKLKMNLENNIQLLEQQLEEMRATYQLNAEKLEYNFRVLQERSDENRETVHNQTSKLKKCKEVLSKLKEKFTFQEQKLKQENTKLTEDYKRITEQFKDLQLKYQHFEQVDLKKFNEVWKMNESDVKELGQKVLSADKIIHDQILNVTWVPPHDDYFSLEYEGPNLNSLDEASLFGEMKKDASMSEESNKSHQRRPSNVNLSKKKFSSEQIQHVLDLLVSEAQFLTSDTSSSSADNVLKSIGITNKDELEELVALFYADGDGDRSSTSQPIIHPNDTIKVIRQFVVDKQHTTGRVKSDVLMEKKNPNKSKEKEFWGRLEQVISEKNYRLWGSLEDSLHKYNKILEDRAKAMEDAITLQQQNEELKSLLKQHFSSVDNEYLKIPPADVIRLNAEENDNKTKQSTPNKPKFRQPVVNRSTLGASR